MMFSRRLFLLCSAVSAVPCPAFAVSPEVSKLPRAMVFGSVANVLLPIEEDLTIHIDGLVDVSAIYDRGVQLERSSWPPGGGQWAMTKDGDIQLGSVPCQPVTGDLLGHNLPPRYRMAPSDFGGIVTIERRKELMA
jgi:hypothetical protein